MIASGCAGPYAEELRLRATAHLSIELHTISLALWGGSRSYRLIDNTVVATGRYQLIRLSPDVATAAWQAIRNLGVLEWQEHYPSSMADGEGWIVHVKLDGQEKSMRGENAYPQRLAPYSSTLHPRANSFEDLLAVLSRLEKEPNKAPNPTPPSVTAPAHVRRNE